MPNTGVPTMSVDKWFSFVNICLVIGTERATFVEGTAMETLRLPARIRRDVAGYRGQVGRFERGEINAAAFRAFRAKTREATLLLIAAFIILIGRTPVGILMTAWLPDSLQWLTIPNLSGWILSVPNMAGQRAVMIGVALGIISTSMKMILGIERSWLGGDDS